MRTALAFLALAALVTVGVSLHAGGEIGAFTLWALSPYGAFLFLCLARRRIRGAAGVSALGAVIASLFGMGTLIDGFYFHLDAQNGLLFIFVPLYQWIGWAFFAVLSAVAAAVSKGK